MLKLEDLIVKPNTVGPDGQPIFQPASNNPPLQGDFIPFGSLPEHWEGFDDDTDVPCGCG